MKSRFISVFLVLASVFLLAASCATDEDWVIPGQPTIEPAPTETPVPTSALWDYTQIDQTGCAETPLYSWKLPGTYSYRTDREIFTSVNDGQNSYPDPEARITADCAILLHPGYYFPGIPTPGTIWQWSGECDRDVDNSHYSQSWNVVIGDWEQKTTAFGTFTALRIEATNNITIDGRPSTHNSTEWYICGYGMIYGKEIRESDNTWDATTELLSFTPLTTDESRVRYILADIQLGGVDGYYREHVDAEEVAEALRRWDAGITVTNIDQFERKLIGDTWQVVYAGTETLIDGKDVLLTTDPQP
jgi:hypothetical protein